MLLAVLLSHVERVVCGDLQSLPVHLQNTSIQGGQAQCAPSGGIYQIDAAHARHGRRGQDHSFQISRCPDIIHALTAVKTIAPGHTVLKSVSTSIIEAFELIAVKTDPMLGSLRSMNHGMLIAEVNL